MTFVDFNGMIWMLNSMFGSPYMEKISLGGVQSTFLHKWQSVQSGDYWTMFDRYYTSANWPTRERSWCKLNTDWCG